MTDRGAGSGWRSAGVAWVVVAALAGLASLVSSAGPTGAGPYGGAEAWFLANDTPARGGGPALTWTGAAAYAPAVNVGAFDFDGSNGLVSDADTTLGNFGADDFVLQFYLRTSQSGTVAVLSKRETCPDTPMWDIRLVDGIVHAEFDPSVPTQHTLDSATPVNDDGWHVVTLRRAATSLTLAVDGSVESSATVAVADGVANAAPLQVGDGDPCIGVDGTQPLVGAIDDLYVGPGPLVDFSVGQSSEPTVPAGGSGVLDLVLSADHAVAGHSGSLTVHAPTGATFTGVSSGLAAAGCSVVDAGSRVACGVGAYDPGTYSIEFSLANSVVPDSTLSGLAGFVDQERPDPNLANSQYYFDSGEGVSYSIRVAPVATTTTTTTSTSLPGTSPTTSQASRVAPSDDIARATPLLPGSTTTAVSSTTTTEPDATATTEPDEEDGADDDEPEEVAAAGQAGAAQGPGRPPRGTALASPTALTQSLPSVVDVFRDPRKIAAAVAGGMVWTLLLVLATGALKTALKSRYDGWTAAARSRLPGFAAWFDRTFGGVAGTALPAVVGLLCVNTFVIAFIDPAFGFDLASLRMFASIVVAEVVAVAGPFTFAAATSRRRSGQQAAVLAAPWGLVLAVFGVFTSRLVGFVPGLLTGSTIRLREGDATGPQRVPALRLLVGGLLAVAGICWVIADLISARGGALALFIHDAATVAAIIGITGATIEMLPLDYFAGSVLYQHARTSWAIITSVSFIAFMTVVLPRPDYWLDVGDRVMWWMTVATIMTVVAVVMLAVLHRGRDQGSGDPGRHTVAAEW